MNHPILLTAFSLVALSACESQVPQTATPLSQAVVTTANVPMPVQDPKGGWNEGNFAYEQLRRKQLPPSDSIQQPTFRHADELRKAELKVGDEGVEKPTGKLGESRLAAPAATQDVVQRRAQYLRELDTWKSGAGNVSEDVIRLNAAKIKARVLLGEAQ